MGEESKKKKEELLSQFIQLYETRNNFQSLVQLIQLVPDNDYLMNLFSDYLIANPIKKRLLILKRCLINNPKSYAAWEHRKRLFKLIKNKQKYSEKEEKFTIKLLKKDPRNFHVWNYRRFWNFKSTNNYFNYSELHDLSLNKTPDPIDLIATDPYYEGGFNLFFRKNDFFYVKKYANKIEFIFQIPFSGKLIFENKIFYLKNLLRFEILEFNELNPIIINNKEYFLKKWEPELSWIKDMIGVDPCCCFLIEIQLFFVEKRDIRIELIEKLKEFDKLRKNYYESLIDSYHEILIPNLDKV